MLKTTDSIVSRAIFRTTRFADIFPAISGIFQLKHSYENNRILLSPIIT
jgi:hypothetical protein